MREREREREGGRERERERERERRQGYAVQGTSSIRSKERAHEILMKSMRCFRVYIIQSIFYTTPDKLKRIHFTPRPIDSVGNESSDAGHMVTTMP